MVRLEPFCEFAVCEKCGSTDVSFRYHRKPEREDPKCGFPPHYWDEGREHIDRVCERCGFAWAMECRRE